MTLWIAFRPEAEVEIERAHDWYEAQRPGLGSHFSLALEAVLSRAADNHDAFPCVARRTHKAVLRRFPYVVFYVVDGDRLLVTGVFHGHRDPGSWADRVLEEVPRYGSGVPFSVAT